MKSGLRVVATAIQAAVAAPVCFIIIVFDSDNRGDMAAALEELYWHKYYAIGGGFNLEDCPGTSLPIRARDNLLQTLRSETYAIYCSSS